MTRLPDEPRLRAHLHQLDLCRKGDKVDVRPLSGGQSNPTYLVEAGAFRCVLRTKPAGQLAPSAHAIDREYRVMKALAASEVPVPQVYVYSEDTSVIGTPFYLMQFMQGRIFTDQALPEMTPREREAIYLALNEVTATLHSVDPVALGLSDFGKHGSYFERQRSRWSRQCSSSSAPLPSSMPRLMEWLEVNTPPPEQTSLTHGDLRLDNVVFHPSRPQVIAVLDWELSTLGHPLSDFAYQCMSWRIAPAVWRGIAGLDLDLLGIPTEREYIAHYMRATGQQVTSAEWRYCMAFNLFRLSAILHGIEERAMRGMANAPDALLNGQRAGAIADLGWEATAE